MIGRSGLTNDAIAHVIADPPRAHLLSEHLIGVGVLAREFGEAFGSGEAAMLGGLLHDAGKYAGAFQKMIREANGFEAHLEGNSSGPRDHSTAGAIFIRSIERVEGDIRAALAFCIAGHHGGLSNASELQERLKKVDLLKAAHAGGLPLELPMDATAPRWLPSLASCAPSAELRRRHEMWIRMVFSCICDADFLDTERFYDADRSGLRGGWPELEKVHGRLARHLDSLQANAPVSQVNRVRAEVRRACQKACADSPGVFTLTAPTGGGKTLAAMEFALGHARAHQLRRVVVAVPFTAIIEQNAAVYAHAMGADAVLEHHSGLDPHRETPRTRVAAENWDAPVIVTTTVQLFESLFGNRSSACRKLHRLARSVILLDEAQALPVGMLDTVLDGLKTLVRDYGATVVISTATQPAFLARPGFEQGIASATELVPQEVQAFQRLHRVRVRWPASLERSVSWESLSAELARETDVLAIVHKRRDARELTLLLDARLGAATCIHLSALMCPAHRSEVLTRLKASRGERGARVIATQLVEAGVDLDFPVVYRALGGLDVLAQAAGRCNREGLLTEGELRVFVAPTDPPPGVPQAGLAISRLLLGKGPVSLDDPATFRNYFEQLYPVRDLDARRVQESRAGLRFKDVAHDFRIVEDDWSASVVVPWRDAQTAVDELSLRGASRERVRALQPYMVNVPTKLRDRWLGQGTAREIEGVVALLPEAIPYDERFGLRLDLEGTYGPSSLIVDG